MKRNKIMHKCISCFMIVFSTFVAMIVLTATWQQANACTGITLKAHDGSIIQGRTMEWGAFDLHSQVMVTPRGLTLQSLTPDGKTGLKWKSKYGVVGLDIVRSTSC